MKQTCSTCHVEKPLDAFYADNRPNKGRTHRTVCKDCCRAYARSDSAWLATERYRAKKRLTRARRAKPVIPEGYISLKEAASRLNVNKSTVSNDYRNGRLAGVKIGKKLYFDQVLIAAQPERQQLYGWRGRKRSEVENIYYDRFLLLLPFLQNGYTIERGCRRLKLDRDFIHHLPAELKRELWYAKAIVSSGFSCPAGIMRRYTITNAPVGCASTIDPFPPNIIPICFPTKLSTFFYTDYDNRTRTN